MYLILSLRLLHINKRELEFSLKINKSLSEVIWNNNYQVQYKYEESRILVVHFSKDKILSEIGKILRIEIKNKITLISYFNNFLFFIIQSNNRR